MTNTIDELVRKVDALLSEEEAAPAASDLAALTARYSRREECRHTFSLLDAAMGGIRARMHRLPYLPPLADVEWANAVLEMDNLRFLVVDTTGVDDHADLIRIHITNRHGEAMYSNLIRPLRPLDDSIAQFANTRYTGIEQDLLLDAQTLAEHWPSIQGALRGCYVLSYNLQFIQEHLRESAKHYGLAPIVLVGACLEQRAQSYFSSNYRYKLSSVCQMLGYPLPYPATAPDRARGQLVFLQAMAMGVRSGLTNTGADDLGELDDHPF